jgi:hypothetical protein
MCLIFPRWTIQLKSKELRKEANFELRTKKPMRLGKLAAVRLQYRLDGQPGEQLIAYRRLTGDRVIYQGWLKTTDEYYAKDAKILTRILSSWQFGPLR